LDVFTSGCLGIVNVETALTLGGLLVNVSAKLVNLKLLVVVVVAVLVLVLVLVVVVVVVVVLLDLHTRDALVLDDGLGRVRKLDSVMSISINTAFGTAGASLIIEKTQVDGESILLRAVGTNKVLSVPVKVSRARVSDTIALDQPDPPELEIRTSCRCCSFHFGCSGCFGCCCCCCCCCCFLASLLG
jgi:hypothetical protein